MTLPGGLTLTLLPARPYCADYTPDTPVAGFAFESQSGFHAFGSDRVRGFDAPANSLAFTPAGCSIYSEASRGGEYLTLAGDQRAMRSFLAAEQGEAHLPSGRFSGRPDPQGLRAAHALRRMLLSGIAEPSAHECAAADFLCAVRSCGGAHWRETPVAASLTPRRLKRVEDLIEARLGERLSVGEMAEACGLSTGFFLRAFKAATGQTPHRFLMERRLARARRALAESGEPISAIAQATGFASHAHLASRFRHSMGLAPAAYRSHFSA